MPRISEGSKAIPALCGEGKGRGPSKEVGVYKILPVVWALELVGNMKYGQEGIPQPFLEQNSLCSSSSLPLQFGDQDSSPLPSAPRNWYSKLSTIWFCIGQGQPEKKTQEEVYIKGFLVRNWLIPLWGWLSRSEICGQAIRKGRLQFLFPQKNCSSALRTFQLIESDPPKLSRKISST